MHIAILYWMAVSYFCVWQFDLSFYSLANFTCEYQEYLPPEDQFHLHQVQQMQQQVQ
jgi:hypothetical protein